MKDNLKIKLILPVTRSLNNLKNHWHRYHDKRKYKNALKNYELLPFCKNIGKEKVKLTIQRYGERIYDEDNYHGGCKQMIDVLKEKGFMYDDRPEFCEIVFLRQIKCKKNEQKIIVKIEKLKKI